MKTFTTSMVTNELHSITDVRRTAASVDEMHRQTQLGTESLTQLEANAVDVDRLRCYHEDADSIPYVQQQRRTFTTWYNHLGTRQVLL